jgi:hypothetical protein
MLGVGLPSHWFVREIFGILFVIFYFFVLPVLLIKSKHINRFYQQMGPTRYYIGMTLVLTMMLMPIKMYFRWLLNLKYFVHIQEFFLNL